MLKVGVMSKTTKALRYFRCLNIERHPSNIENLIRISRERLPTVGSSEINFVDEVIRIQHFRAIDEGGLFIHFVRYVPGENSDTIAPGGDDNEDDEEPHSAPDGMEYKDGDFFMYCRGHNIIGCAHGMNMQPSKIEIYLKAYIKKGSVEDANPDGTEHDFSFSTALNIEKYRLLETHGVSSISFSASSYAASYGQQRNNSLMARVRQSIGDAIRDRIGRLDDQREIEIMEDLVVNASIRLDGNTRADEGAKGEIRRIAEESIDENGITIYTMKNEPLTSESIRMQKKLGFDKRGKSIYYDDVWQRMREYYIELRSEGFLEE